MKPLDSGFSYLEAMVAMVVATITLGVMGPLFMNQRQQNVDSEMQTGAMSLAQTTLEGYRQSFRDTLPTLTTAAGTNSDQTLTGRTYGVNVRILDFRGRNTDGTLNCDTVATTSSHARCIRIQVRPGTSANNGAPIYEVETVYTQIQ